MPVQRPGETPPQPSTQRYGAGEDRQGDPSPRADPPLPGFHTVEIGHQVISGGGGRQQGSDAAYASVTGEIRVVWSHGATPPGSWTGAVFVAARDGSLAAIASVGQRFVVLTETPPPGSGALPLARGQLARVARQLAEHYEP